MTALLADQSLADRPIASPPAFRRPPVLSHSGGPGARGPVRARRPATLPGHRLREVHGCSPVSPSPAAGPTEGLRPVLGGGRVRYEWTTRGIAVMLAVVLLVLGILAATAVAAFVSVSNEPVALLSALR